MLKKFVSKNICTVNFPKKYEDGCLLGCFILYGDEHPDNKNSKLLWNVGKYLPNHTVSHARK